MKNKIKNISCILLIAVFLIFSFMATNIEKSTAYADTENLVSNSNEATNNLSSTKAEDKIYSKATLEDEFCDDSIIVVLDEELSSLNTKINLKFNKLFKDIKFNKINNLSEKVAKAREKNNNIFKKPFKQILQLELKNTSKQNVLTTIDILEKVEGVLYVGPDFISSMEASPTPNDPKRYEQWGLSGTYGINASQAWDITTGSNNVRVGIIDTELPNTKI